MYMQLYVPRLYRQNSSETWALVPCRFALAHSYAIPLQSIHVMAARLVIKLQATSPMKQETKSTILTVDGNNFTLNYDHEKFTYLVHNAGAFRHADLVEAEDMLAFAFDAIRLRISRDNSFRSAFVGNFVVLFLYM